MITDPIAFRLNLSRLVLFAVHGLLAVARWLTPDIENRP